ncbi:MAG: hypothetical protein AAF752_03865, partial [Bacteroidota bacterium]
MRTLLTLLFCCWAGAGQAQTIELALDDGNGTADSFSGWGNTAPFFWANQFDAGSSPLTVTGARFYARTEQAGAREFVVDILDAQGRRLTRATATFASSSGRWTELSFPEPQTFGAGTTFYLRAGVPDGGVPYPAGVDQEVRSSGSPGVSFFASSDSETLTPFRPEFVRDVLLLRAIGTRGGGQSAPVRPVLESPDQDATDLRMPVTLRWQDGSTDPSQTASEFEVELSTSSTFSPVLLRTSVSGTQVDVGEPNLTHGEQYHWRVRGENGAGTSDWSAARFFLTRRGGALQVVPSAPSNGAAVSTAEVELTWNAVAGASSYTLNISTMRDFTNTFVSVQEANTRYVLGGLRSGQQYYWRVLASNAGRFNWSETFAFTTGDIAPPAAPTLTSPASGATDVDPTQPLQWEAVDEATRYYAEIALADDLSQLVESGVIEAGTAFSPAMLLYGEQYAWRVRAEGSSGLGPWSAWAVFDTRRGGPRQVRLSAPADASERIDRPVTLGWGAVSGASTYAVQISQDETFESVLLTAEARETFYIPGPATLQAGETYVWRVRAGNTGRGNWSDEWRFSTQSIPEAGPVLSLPSDGSTVVGPSQSFEWSAIPGTSTYTLSISDAGGFDDAIKVQTPETSAVVDELEPGVTYNWRVRALVGAEPSPWSPVWQVTIAE